MKHLHPRTDDAGQPVELERPSRSTPLASWDDPGQIATVVPDGPMPQSLNGIALAAWSGVPNKATGWWELVAQNAGAFADPPMLRAPGKPAASGVVILESDGRVWVVSPSNQHGGYVNTFPKVEVNQGTDYKYRARVPREAVAQVLHNQVMNLDWSNFKGAVKAKKRHDAYMNVWSAMHAVQDR